MLKLEFINIRWRQNKMSSVILLGLLGSRTIRPNQRFYNNYLSGIEKISEKVFSRRKLKLPNLNILSVNTAQLKLVRTLEGLEHT